MELTVNRQVHVLEDDLDDMLVWILRDDLGLTGTKFGCGLGICGSCAVLVDGQPVRSCVTPIAAVAGKAVTTIEGLGSDSLHPVQAAFLEHQTPQCAWCMSGQMMTAAAFLAHTPNPTEAEIDAAMNANYCRCGCYVRIRSAVMRAAEMLRDA